MLRARVIEEHKTQYLIQDGGKEYAATVRGSFFAAEAFPKVGDWVVYQEVSPGNAVIEAIEPRHSVIARKAVGHGGEQVIVANVDLIIVVMGLDGDFNLSRLERYLLLAEQSSITPLVVLNKADTVEQPEDFIARVKERASDVSVLALSAETGEGVEQLLPYLGSEVTAVLLGSSGAGKSTLTNQLLQQQTQATNAVRTDDSHGRHTTTSRQLFRVPSGAALIDTPGMRELGVLSSEHDEASVFANLDALAEDCRFPNCDHEKSKGCAILAALNAGNISEQQFNNYQKLRRERFFEESKHDEEAARDFKQRQKNLHKGYRQIQKHHRREKGW